ELIERHQRIWPVIRRTIHPLRRRYGLELSLGEGWPNGAELHSLRTNLIDGFRPTFARLAAGMGATLDDLIPVVDALVDHYDRFPDRFAQLLHAPECESADLPAHALLTCAASVAIAARLSWARDDIRLTGVTALVMDAGMVMVPKSSRCSVEPLDAFGYARVDRHPAHTVALIEPGDLPQIVSLAAYQHHERLDASGYPHRAPGHEICSIARVLAVADAYVASVSERPYRPPHRPYEALEDIILLASKGVLDRKAVRALTEITGLYPVGGYVRLSTGESARVIGADPDNPDRPDVVTVDTPRRRLVRLSDRASTSISVVEPIDPPLSVRTRRVA
ncbi:MAG: HD domain-containing phosphohydrolase, partial [Planctomycetota bacterium]